MLEAIRSQRDKEDVSLESLHREDSPADSLILDLWPPKQ